MKKWVKNKKEFVFNVSDCKLVNDQIYLSDPIIEKLRKSVELKFLIIETTFSVNHMIKKSYFKELISKIIILYAGYDI